MAVKIFCCYAHEDEALLNKLKRHLRPLQRQGLIDVWHDRDISPGAEWEKEISQHLNEAQIILLLISPDFMNSDYCYGTEMKKALSRHNRGEACVIPIILRACYWQIAGLDKLQALPTDAIPVVNSKWHTQDDAYLIIVKGIEKKIAEFRNQPPTAKSGNNENGKQEPRKENIEPVPPLYMEGLVEKAFTKGGEVEPTLVMEKNHTTQIHYPELENSQESNEITNEADVSVSDVVETAKLVGKQIADGIKRTRKSFLGKSPISVLMVLFLLFLTVNIVYLPLQSLSFLFNIVSFLDTILMGSILLIFGFNRDYIIANFKEEIPSILRKIMEYFKSD